MAAREGGRPGEACEAGEGVMSWNIPNGCRRGYCIVQARNRAEAAACCDRLAADPRNAYRRRALLNSAADYRSRAAAWQRAADDGRA